MKPLIQLGSMAALALSWLVAFTCAFEALSVAALAGATVAAGAPAFVPGPCPRMPRPIAELKSARCGRLTVPESRQRLGGKMIRLSVAIIPAKATKPKSDPIVWLAGGPGDDAITEVPMALAGKLNETRDVIFMSQRGTYSAQPKLTCGALDRWGRDTLNMKWDAAAAGNAYSAATLKCRRELTAKTGDLGAYNTLESADDLEDLRIALHIAKWNLYGISYGTDLALNYMRQHPEGIRAVGIAGVLPPSLAGGGSTWTSAGVGVLAVFKACRAQSRCRQRYGDIGATFNRLVRQYEASPKSVKVRVPGPPGTVHVMISGGMLVQWTVSPGTHFAAKVPAAIDALAHTVIPRRSHQPGPHQSSIQPASVHSATASSTVSPAASGCPPKRRRASLNPDDARFRQSRLQSGRTLPICRSCARIVALGTYRRSLQKSES